MWLENRFDAVSFCYLCCWDNCHQPTRSWLPNNTIFRWWLRTVGVMYLAAACRPDALWTWTTSVTIREAAPIPLCPLGLIGWCLYRMHTSNRPGKEHRTATKVKMQQYDSIQYCIGISLDECVYLRAEADALWDCVSSEPGSGRTFGPYQDAVSAWWPWHTVWTTAAFLWPQADLGHLDNNICRDIIIMHK